MVGFTEASITRRPIDTDDAQPLVDDHHRVTREPHLGDADGMENCDADLAGNPRSEGGINRKLKRLPSVMPMT